MTFIIVLMIKVILISVSAFSKRQTLKNISWFLLVIENMYTNMIDSDILIFYTTYSL